MFKKPKELSKYIWPPSTSDLPVSLCVGCHVVGTRCPISADQRSLVNIGRVTKFSRYKERQLYKRSNLICTVKFSSSA